MAAPSGSHRSIQQTEKSWIRATSDGQSWGTEVPCIAPVIRVAKHRHKLTGEGEGSQYPFFFFFLSGLGTIFFFL